MDVEGKKGCLAKEKEINGVRCGRNKKGQRGGYHFKKAVLTMRWGLISAAVVKRMFG